MERGIAIYKQMAVECGLPPDECIGNVNAMLSAPWDFGMFMEALGNDDELAIIEARGHFGMAAL